MSTATSFPHFPDANANMVISSPVIDGQYDLRTMDIGWVMKTQNYRLTDGGRLYSKVCLGSVLCMDQDCLLKHVDQRPRSDIKLIAAQRCQHCNGQVSHVQCKVRVRFLYENGECHMSHLLKKGKNDPLTTQSHTHKAYIPVHLPAESAKALENVVKTYPNEISKALVVGTPSGSGGIAPVRNIHPLLNNIERTRYERRKIAKSAGILNSMQTSIEDFLVLQKENPNMIRLCNINIDEFILSVKANSVDRMVDFKAYPLITDVTFSVFQDYYFCSTVIYCEELRRHVVLYAAAIRNLKASVFESYFVDLFKAYDIQLNENSFLGMVMDYSAAQIKGFLDAFAKTTEKKPKSGLKFLKGCEVHFKRSISKLVKPTDVVLPLPKKISKKVIDKKEQKSAIKKQQSRLKKLAYDLLKASNKQEFKSSAKKILQKFPKAKAWVNFWTRKPVRSMAFKAGTKMNNALHEHKTTTTNGIESYHRDLYRVLKKHQGLLVNIKVRK
jgi:hypothetical protein